MIFDISSRRTFAPINFQWKQSAGSRSMGRSIRQMMWTGHSDVG